MAQHRFAALDQVSDRPVDADLGRTPISSIFGKYVFGLITMKEYLTDRAYRAVLDAIKLDKNVDVETAENVAKGLKKWAMDLGATHFTHWFQPLTGLTAEKHDSFYKPQFNKELYGIEKLSGAELIQREPDASSFPSGGMRGTSDARGYTVWDPTSPAFILKIKTGLTLYIPSVFISYTGESLDHKAPLLKSIRAVQQATVKVCQYFDRSVKSAVPTLGWEQEYFVLDEGLAMARPDLNLAGRTLFGNASAKGQERSDHYFGTIPERVQKFMNDYEQYALELGIPLQTRHNEVAPSQYEAAPMFEEINVAVDHNMLLMNIMRQIAKQHGLSVLFHEKPFAGLNGSGKHNNWSLSTGQGQNLLEPGEMPGSNLQFLTFFICVIRAVDKHAKLLRAGIASASNDLRLGGHEAPPAIISVFTGSFLEGVLRRFQKEGLYKDKSESKHHIKLDLPRIPNIEADVTDRNRTSSFPFTGNKFEFRAVGASANPSFIMTVLNTAVADVLDEFAADVEKAMGKGKKGKASQEDAMVKVLQGYLKECEKVIYNSDGYSDTWQKEAAKRGLPNIATSPEAYACLTEKDAKSVFEKHNVFTPRELEGRVNVLLENYCLEVGTEAQLVIEMAHTHILPSVVAYQKELLAILDGYEEVDMLEKAKHFVGLVENIQAHIEKLLDSTEKLRKAHAKAQGLEDVAKQADQMRDKVLPLLGEVREAADTLENLVDDSSWKLPKYRELLFVK